MAIEEQFYFVWPLLLLLLGTSRARWTAFVLALGIETWRWFDETYHMSTSLTRLYGNQFLTDHRADSLLWGCVLALFFPYLRQKISVRAASVAAVAAPCVAVAFFAIHMPLVYFWQPFLITSAIAATVLSPAGWVGRLLELRILTTIGIGSYSLYLWQQLFLPVFAAGRPLGLVQQTPFNLVCIAVAAYLSYRFVEQPLIRFGRQLTRRQHDPSPQAISATTAGAN